jgi:hypothetical protein
MATSTYLSNPGVEVNSVSLTDQCTSCTVNSTIESLESQLRLGLLHGSTRLDWLTMKLRWTYTCPTPPPKLLRRFPA